MTQCTIWYIESVLITDQIFIATTPERLWTITADVERWPATTPTISSVVLQDSPIELGSRALVTQPRLRPATWTVTVFDAPTDFAWQRRLLGTVMTGSHRILSVEGGVLNVLSIELEGALGAVLGMLLKRSLLKTIRTENLGFRRFAEANQLLD